MEPSLPEDDKSSDNNCQRETFEVKRLKLNKSLELTRHSTKSKGVNLRLNNALIQVKLSYGENNKIAKKYPLIQTLTHFHILADVHVDIFGPLVNLSQPLERFAGHDI